MKKKKIKLKQEVHTHISDLRQFVKKVVLHRKQYEDDEIENPDAKEFYGKLFDTVEWLIEHNAYEQIQGISDGIDDDESEVINDIINDVVYRFEYPVDDGKGGIDSLIVTPFAIPIMIMAPITYMGHIARLKELPKTIVETTSTKLLRNCLDLGLEPTTIIDNRLWKNDEAGWDNFGIIMQYLRGFIANISNLSPTVQSLKVRNASRPNKHIEEQDSLYAITGTITGVVISEDVDIDAKLFGYVDTEKGIMENSFTNEFAISCESELNSMGIEDVRVQPLSPWPVELWEVPEIVVHFIHILDLRKKANQAASETPYSGGNRTISIVPDQKNDAIIIRILVYDEHLNKPFFTYTWDVAHGLETPESVIDDIMRICTEELKVNNVLID